MRFQLPAHYKLMNKLNNGKGDAIMGVCMAAFLVDHKEFGWALTAPKEQVEFYREMSEYLKASESPCARMSGDIIASMINI
ncbi:MAG: hypothetical protein A2017_09240 [Lentisphaerae bacterium GWF2_44_16]|nr:MAG: hypothetical protein A2017_09240 [Lentisphaerae bacterium GWF2_44_16]